MSFGTSLTAAAIVQLDENGGITYTLGAIPLKIGPALNFLAFVVDHSMIFQTAYADSQTIVEGIGRADH